MSVPKLSIPPLGRHLSRLFALALLLGWTTVSLFARSSDPPLRIPLEPLGFQPLSTQFLLAGGSMLSLHYVDDTHLLLTFSVHRLLSRLPDEPEDDQDRNVDALLLELPTGRVVARTSWRLHDHGQYLWSIGHGRFLLRIRDAITLLAPLANLASGEPFREQSFLNTENLRIATIDVSPDGNLLTVETVKRTPPVPRPKTPLFGPAPSPPPMQFTSVQINFYRLPDSADPAQPIQPRYAGVLRATAPGTIPALDSGYIAVIDQGHQHWAFDFNSYSGKKQELSPFDSVCRPIPFWVSRSEFIAFGCRVGTTRQLLGGFNMRGDEIWEQNLFGAYTSPSLVFAPATGRFALGRTMVHSATSTDQAPLVAEELGAQTVVVYQTESGKQLLRVDCTPVQPAGQNFALSPNGLSLALVHDNAIEIHQLPNLTDKDAADLKLAQAAAPPETELPIRFRAESTPSPEGEDTATAEPALPAPATESAVAPAVPTPPALPDPTVALGDPQPGNQPRKRPTLYTLPTDPPHPTRDDQPQ